MTSNNTQKKFVFQVKASKVSSFYYHGAKSDDLWPFATFVPSEELLSNNKWLKSYFQNRLEKFKLRNEISKLNDDELVSIITDTGIENDFKELIIEEELKGEKIIKVSEVEIETETETESEEEETIETIEVKEIKEVKEVKEEVDILSTSSPTITLTSTTIDIPTIETSTLPIPTTSTTLTPSTTIQSILEKNVAEKKTIIINAIQKSLEKKINNSIQSTKDNKNSQWAQKIKNDIIKDKIVTKINQQRGVKFEKPIIKSYEKDNKKSVTNSNNVFYKNHLELSESISLYIIGKIDGIEKDSETNEEILIEVKKRANRLFNFIPLYEKIQLEIYFWLLSSKKITKSKLIENYDSKTIVHEYKHNPEFFEELKKGLLKFFEEFIEKYKLTA